MRRAIAFVVCVCASCAFPDLSGLTGGDAGADASGDAIDDVPVDAPVWQRSAGDVDVFWASITGVVSTRAWSASSKTWTPPATVGAFSLEVVPQITAAASTSVETLALSSWSGASSGAASFHLLEAATFSPKVSAPSVVSGAQAPHRTFDVAFEHSSGDALAVFANGSNAPQFATRANGAWSAPAAVAQNGLGATVDWVLLAPSPISDEITLVFSDTSHALFATTWNGQAWMSQSPTKLDAGALNVSDFAAFGAAYGATKGDLLVVWAHASSCSGGVDPLYYATKTHGSNAFAASSQTSSVIASPGPISMASEPGTDRIAIAMLEWCNDPTIRQNGENDFSAAIWDGAAFASMQDVDSTPAVDYTTRIGAAPVGAAWVGSSGTAIVVYEDTNTLSWAKWSGSSWSLQIVATQSPSLPVVADFQLLRLASGDVMLLLEDVNQSLWAKRYDGSVFDDMNGGVSLSEGLYVDNGRPFAGVVVP